jgi:L-alanine-DL-glutamate epimerase-like enolase superfamily enzyme
MRTFIADSQSYPIRGIFRISRGEKTEARVVEVSISEDDFVGHGECVPYARYGETIESVLGQLAHVKTAVEQGLSRADLQDLLRPGAARNAIDCAMWDLEARTSGIPVAKIAEVGKELHAVDTAFTLSLDSPEAMAQAANANAHLPLLKLKLGGLGDLERVRAVRAAAPSIRLIADANESWSTTNLQEYLPTMHELGVELIEQPLPAGDDDFLETFDSPVPLAADESCRDLQSLRGLAGKYSIANIKLDKTGGLTEAIQLQKLAHSLGFRTMIGCMVATSLSMAPGLVVAQHADVVHLDGPMLLQRDRNPSLKYSGGLVHPSDGGVWAK